MRTEERPPWARRDLNKNLRAMKGTALPLSLSLVNFIYSLEHHAGLNQWGPGIACDLRSRRGLTFKRRAEAAVR